MCLARLFHVGRREDDEIKFSSTYRVPEAAKKNIQLAEQAIGHVKESGIISLNHRSAPPFLPSNSFKMLLSRFQAITLITEVRKANAEKLLAENYNQYKFNFKPSKNAEPSKDQFYISLDRETGLTYEVFTPEKILRTGIVPVDKLDEIFSTMHWTYFTKDIDLFPWAINYFKSLIIYDMVPLSDLEHEFLRACIYQYHKIGNCYEQTVIALIWLHMQGVPAEVCKLNEHFLLCLGRAAGSDKNDIKTWGESCVLCDLWDSTAYPAAHFFEEQKKVDENNNHYAGYIYSIRQKAREKSSRIPELQSFLAGEPRVHKTIECKPNIKDVLSDIYSVSKHPLLLQLSKTNLQDDKTIAKLINENKIEEKALEQLAKEMKIPPKELQKNIQQINKDDEIIIKMRALVQALKKEISSCWPYPNKPIKRHKIDCLNIIIEQYIENFHLGQFNGLGPVLEKVRKDNEKLFALAIQGKHSTRTQNLIIPVRLEKPKKTNHPSL